MLRCVLLISRSGLVLFSKQLRPVSQVSEWTIQHTRTTICADIVCTCMSWQPRLLGSLIRTIIEFSVKTTGLPVSHIELAGGSTGSLSHFTPPQRRAAARLWLTLSHALPTLASCCDYC